MIKSSSSLDLNTPRFLTVPVRVHDLRHTYGQRLQDAGASEEDRALLLGHAGNGMPQHYAAATVARLLEAANAVLKTRDRTMVLRVVNG